MATADDVRAILARLPDAAEGPDELHYRVRGKPICWPWQERPRAVGRRVPNPDVLAIRVAGEDRKQDLLALDAGAFFTEPHYDGYPAVQVRLDAIDDALLAEVIRQAWQSRAKPVRARR
jgi:hypothetical protein